MCYHKNTRSLFCKNVIVMVPKQQVQWIEILCLRQPSKHKHNGIYKRHCHIICH